MRFDSRHLTNESEVFTIESNRLKLRTYGGREIAPGRENT
ncbi:hypothetical protein PROFUN_11359 [Planoprotostelium fungivorum]|uniref:Uncharacterized protein n=1 Tax=Planoprotostelium fungivorum TaxID=1890364 RepID=A0A2P6NAD0_9EUKA|nr:hypothetical protein PROFUN_11359 [Planoprotostelium fungivorum]